MPKIGNGSSAKKTVKYTLSIEEKYDVIVTKLIESGKFRNKTHVVEEAIKLLNEKERGGVGGGVGGD
jgi:Arc/MetJ-type ribon-helix-helix transcriptional regulator